MITYETINSLIKNVKTIRIAICPILSQSIGAKKFQVATQVPVKKLA